MRRHFVLCSSGLLVLAFGGFATWILLLPRATAAGPPEPVPEGETRAVLSSLKPTKREPPLIAIVGINDATETTDYIIPYGILRRANVADVIALATEAGPVKLFPALRVDPDATIDEFDRMHPDGADYVIVPAMSRDDDPKVIVGSGFRRREERW